MIEVVCSVAQQSAPEYAHEFSPRTFLQHQLFACLVLKSFLNTDNRGGVAYWCAASGTAWLQCGYQVPFVACRTPVLWAHGIAASDYIEEGDVSVPATWSRFSEVFNNDLFGFAAWIN